MRKERRDSCFVCFQLVIGIFNSNSIVCRILELEERNWQAVYEDNDIRPFDNASLFDSELVDDEEIICLRALTIENKCFLSLEAAVNLPNLNVDPIGYHAMEIMVIFKDTRVLRYRDFAICFLKRFSREIRIDAFQGSHT